MSQGSGIAVLILAAGQSSRMGLFKPLAPLGRSTFIEESIGAFQKAGLQDVRVVVHPRSRDLITMAERVGARCLPNPDPSRGMFSSVLTGVESLGPEIHAFFLMPADMPLIRPQTIRALLEVYEQTLPKVIHPRFLGRRGHPPLVPTAFFPKGVSTECPGGMRAVLAALEAESFDVDVADEGVLLDCDTPADYERILRRWFRSDIPTEAECDAIGSLLQVPALMAAHGFQVAEVAGVLARHLNRAGHTLDEALLHAAGRLHVLVQEPASHTWAGSTALESLGFPRVAAVLAQTATIDEGGSQVTESELLKLADLCTDEERVASLDDHFECCLNGRTARADAPRDTRRRWDHARSIAQRVERAVGAPLSTLLRPIKTRSASAHT